LDVVVVWALRASSPTLSFGSLQPWNFCWVSSIWVLLGSFYVFAGIVLVLNLVITGVLIFVACSVLRVRQELTHVKNKHNDVSDIVTMVLVVNFGVIGIICGGVFYGVYASSIQPPLFMIISVLTFCESLTLWISVVLRKGTLFLWYEILLCRHPKSTSNGSRVSTTRKVSNSSSPKSSSSSLSWSSNTPNSSPRPIRLAQVGNDNEDLEEVDI
jgi:hypothetical protein